MSLANMRELMNNNLHEAFSRKPFDPATRAFAREIRLTPVCSPKPNGRAEVFVRTLKHDYVRVNPRPGPDARTVMEQLPSWLAHYNEVHSHHALGYRSPREYTSQTRKAPSGR